MSWSQLNLPSYLRWPGIVIGFICLPLIHLILSGIGTYITKVVEMRTDPQLVTSGPYHYMRHPLYMVGTAMLSHLR